MKDNEIIAISNLYRRYYDANKIEPKFLDYPKDSEQRKTLIKEYNEHCKWVRETACNFVRTNIEIYIDYLNDIDKLNSMSNEELPEWKTKGEIRQEKYEELNSKLIW